MTHSRLSITAMLGILACAVSIPTNAEAGRTVHRIRTVTTTTVTTYVPQPRPVVVHHVQRVPVYYPVVYRERPVVYPVRVYNQAYYRPSYSPLLYARPIGLLGYSSGYRGHHRRIAVGGHGRRGGHIGGHRGRH
jgi:hypothetical protein